VDAREAIIKAGNAIRRARRLSGAKASDYAADQITAARTALGRAEDAARAATERLAKVRSVRADPDAPAAAVRFVIRDARFLHGVAASVDHQAFLQAADAELDELAAAARGPRRDHLDHLNRLVYLRLRIREVIDEVRSARRVQ